jgi:hypothetical protein
VEKIMSGFPAVRRAATSGVALALTAGALVAGATSASADSVYGRTCSPPGNTVGTKGYICTQVELTSYNLRFARAYSEPTSGHSICILGVALYVQASAGVPAAVEGNNNVATCASYPSLIDMRSSPEYSVQCFGVASYAWSAARYTVDGGPVERIESTHVKVC